MASDPQSIILIYRNETGESFEQPLGDITSAGTLIDPKTGDELELTGWRFAEGQDYILVDGGLVQNDPALPVFDLDVLDCDSWLRDRDAIDEVLDLRKRMTEHTSAAHDWSTAIERADSLVLAYGTDEQKLELSAIVREGLVSDSTRPRPVNSRTERNPQ